MTEKPNSIANDGVNYGMVIKIRICSIYSLRSTRKPDRWKQVRQCVCIYERNTERAERWKKKWKKKEITEIPSIEYVTYAGWF